MIRSVRPTYRHVFAVVAVVVSLYFGVRTSNAVLADRVLALQMQNAQGTVATIEQQNAALRAQLAYEQTPAYAEQVAREQLGLMRPGDHVVTVHVAAVPPGIAAAAPTPMPAPAPARQATLPNWQRWLRLFTKPAAIDAAPTLPARRAGD